MVALMLAAGCDAPVEQAEEEDAQAHIEALCEDYCPLRQACVRDGWAGGSVEACISQCADRRLYERGGELSPQLVGQLECLAELSCEELAAAVQSGATCAAEPVDFDSAGLVEE